MVGALDLSALRWFDGAVSTAFHFVLAAYVVTLGVALRQGWLADATITFARRVVRVCAYPALIIGGFALFLWLRPPDATSRAGQLSHAAILRETLLQSDETSYTSGALVDLEDVVQDPTSGSKQETLTLDAPRAVRSVRESPAGAKPARPMVDLEELCRPGVRTGRAALRVETARTKEMRRALLSRLDGSGVELVVDDLVDDARLREFVEELRGATPVVVKRDVRVLGNHHDKLVCDVLERVWIVEGEGRCPGAFVLDTRGHSAEEAKGGLGQRAATIRTIAAAVLGLDPASVEVLVVALEAGAAHRA